MTRVDRVGFIAHCATCGDPVNLDATPEAMCDTCGQVTCEAHWPDDCLGEVPC